MRKFLVVLFVVFGLSILFAELEVDIPFNPDQVGPAYSTQGNYVYEGETFYVTNTAVTDTFYLNLYAYEIPAPWNMFWCHEGTCSYLGWGPWNVVLEENVGYDIHANIEVYNMAGSFNYQFVFNHESLVDSVVIDFSFCTEDATNAENDLISEPVILLQNYPNPFNPAVAGRSPITTISFIISRKDAENAKNCKQWRIEIYNIKGQLIKTFTNLTVSNNSGSVIWDGKDKNGKIVESGIYLYRLSGMENPVTRKMILMK